MNLYQLQKSQDRSRLWIEQERYSKKLYVKTNGEIIGILTSVVQLIDQMVMKLHGMDLRREHGRSITDKIRRRNI